MNLSKKEKASILAQAQRVFMANTHFKGDLTFALNRFSSTVQHFLKKYPNKQNYLIGGMPYESDEPGCLDNVWEHHLLLVFLGIKPMCLIDNDMYPGFEDSILDIMNELNQLKYCCEQYGMKKMQLNLATDTGCLYFWEQNRNNAILLYYYYHDKIKLPLYKDGALSQFAFDVFQGILLGYSYEDCIKYHNERYATDIELLTPVFKTVSKFIAKEFRRLDK